MADKPFLSDSEDVALKDKVTIEQLLEVCRQMTLEELWRFCEGTLRASALSQRVLIEKHGLEEWQRFNEAVETGRIKV